MKLKNILKAGALTVALAGCASQIDFSKGTSPKDSSFNICATETNERYSSKDNLSAGAGTLIQLAGAVAGVAYGNPTAPLAISGSNKKTRIEFMDGCMKDKGYHRK